MIESKPNLSGKVILVTGGTGFIGAPLCTTLLEHSAKIFVLTRSAAHVASKINYIQSLKQLKAAPDIIINLAGETIAQRWTSAAKKRIYTSRINTTAALIDYMRSAHTKPSLFISASAIGYYGASQTIQFDETTPPSNKNSFGQQLCQAWESQALQAEQFAVRTVILRIGVVLGKDGGMLAKISTQFKLGMGGPIGTGQQILSWIDRDDLIRLILFIINNESIQGVVNATTMNPVTNYEFAHNLASSLHRPCKLSTPAFALRLAFGEMAEELMLSGQKVIPKKVLQSGFDFLYPTMLESLGKIFKHD